MLWVSFSESWLFVQLLWDGADDDYSFGAVVEEFEVRDALLAIFAEKDGNPYAGPVFTAQEVPVYG